MGYHGVYIYIYIHTMRGVRRWLPGWILLGHMLDLYNIGFRSGLEYTSGHQFNGTKINHWILGRKFWLTLW